MQVSYITDSFRDEKFPYPQKQNNQQQTRLPKIIIARTTLIQPALFFRKNPAQVRRDLSTAIT
jgi:hypothetical protein